MLLVMTSVVSVLVPGLLALRDVLLPVAVRRNLLPRRQRGPRRSKRLQERPVPRQQLVLGRTSRLDHPDAERRVPRSTLHQRGRFPGPGAGRGQRRAFVIFFVLQMSAQSNF